MIPNLAITGASKSRSCKGFYQRCIVLVLVVFTSQLWAQEDDVLEWEPDRRLTWEDFKGKPNPKSEFKAETNWRLAYTYRLKTRNGELFPTYYVDTYFVHNDSWLKEGKETPLLLRHEQGHFDIAEVCARDLRMRFEKHELTSDDHQQEIQAIFQTLLDDCYEMQQAYDRDTDHGLNKEQQKAWDKKIGNELHKFSEFAQVED